MKNWFMIGLLATAAIGVYVVDFLQDAPLSRFSDQTPEFESDTSDPGVPPSASIGGTAALSGDTVRFGGHVFQLADVRCPDPATEDGRSAKALANTFLNIEGIMRCEIVTGATGTTGDCHAKTHVGMRSLSAVMIASGYCN